MSFLRKLFRIRESKVNEQLGRAFIADTGPSIWGKTETPPIDRRAFVQLYEENPLARASVDMTVSFAVGGGFFSDVTEDAEAKRIVDKFAKTCELDELLQKIVRDMLVTGDGIAEKIYDREEEKIRKVIYEGKTEEQEVIGPVENAKLVNLKWVPSYTLEVKRTPVGQTMWWRQSSMAKTKYFHPDKILDFQYNTTGTSSYGTSQLLPAFVILKDLEEIEKNFVQITKRYSSPAIVWSCKGLSASQIEEHKRRVEGKKPTEDIYVNTDLIEPKVLEIDPRGSFENYYTQLMNVAIIALQTPSLPMVGQATRASAEQLSAMFLRRILSIRRLVARIIENDVFTPLIKQAGRTEVPRIRWREPSTWRDQIELSLKLFSSGLYTPSQIEQVLKKLGIEFPPKLEKEQGEVK